MSDPTQSALARWDLSGATCSFVAGRENRVYKVTADHGTFALRFKRQGYRTRAELGSELDWMAAMARAGLSVPKPQPSLEGALLEEVDGQLVDMLSWLGGRPLGATRQPLELEDAPATFRDLGRKMAHLHLASDVWQRPGGFTRHSWDAEGLLGEAPLWGRFWENPTLAPADRSLLTEFRDMARAHLATLTLDTGLIHADLVRENVLLDGPTLHLIDFDDGGFGFRLFDIATALLKNRDAPDYPALKDALIAGYQEHRQIDLGPLDLFLALRAATYVGWIVPRLHEEGSAERCARFTEDARAVCTEYMTHSRVHHGG